MAVPDLEPLDTLDLADLRELVGTLLAELGQLRSEVLALRAESQALKDEIARCPSSGFLGQTAG
jgi:hypothetical protein